ncbi:MULTISPECIES: hypothetical protein [Proteus]|uniref:hypothetical protein n=1 Tax=Proteus TaxID=583 RepID=UPI0013789B88|nr:MULTISPECIES: hypothetical protein [Proteus]MBJ2108290.1 hypothetical protein [Proteus terrae]MBJ2132162.1 hypothetical protein [Proteus terrae]NBM12386.1 hypothetical protein [Proteus sp. G2670]NBM33596.1 hypothetical protein [Proteus sp. G2664]
MDTSRQQFEEFIKFHMNGAEINNKFETANNGLNYADQYVDLMWIGWEASRESLINNLEPVGYMKLEGGNNIKEYGFTHIYEEKFDKETIPLYRLD